MTRSTWRLAAFLAASLIVPTSLSLLGGAPWQETALGPLAHFAKGEHGDASWSSLEKGLDYVTGRPRARSLYDATFFSRRLQGEGFAFPPPALLLLEPAARAGSARAVVAALIWLAVPLTAVLLALLDRRSAGAAALGGSRAEGAVRAALAVLATFTFHPLMSGYVGGEIQTVATALFAGAVLAWVSGRAATAGALVAVMAVFRPSAAFLLLWALVRGQWRFAAGFAAVGLPLLAASIGRYGLPAHLEYFGVLEFLVRRGESFHENQSLNGLLQRLLENGPALRRFGDSPAWIAHFPPHHPLIHGATIAAGAALLAAALWPPRAGAPRADAADFGIAALAATLASPVAWTHHYGVLLPVFVVLRNGLAPVPGAGRALAAVYLVAATPLVVTRALVPTSFAVLQSTLLFAGLATLGLLYAMRARAPRTAAAPPAGTLRARLDWRPTAAAARTAVLSAAVAAVAITLVSVTVVYDAAQATTGVLLRWDPELFYMLNSLLPFEGHGYAFIDHPGTPVETIGTLFHLLLWPAAALRSETPAEFAVQRPWVFLALGHGLLTLASVAVVVRLAWRAVPRERWDDVVLAVAVACAFYTLHSHAFETLIYWSHNSFNFPAGGLLGLTLYLRLREGTMPSGRWLLAMGLAAGGLTACQMYMGAWLIGIAVAVAALALLLGLGARRALRAALVVAGGGAAGFVLFTLPIAPRYPEFLRFMASLASRQGIYGSGEAGFSFAAWLANARMLVSAHSGLFAVAAILVVAIAAAAVRDRRVLRRDAGRWAVALGLAVHAAVLLAAIFKHPGVLYLLSIATLCPLLMAIAFSCWRTGGWAGRAACTAGAVLVIAGFAGRAAGALTTVGIPPLSLARGQADIVRALAAYGGDAPVLRVWSNGTDSPCFALWLANINPLRSFSAEIARRCPRDGMAWFAEVDFPEAWLGLDPGTAGVLISTEHTLETQPDLRWGDPVVTDVSSLFLGKVVFIPFRLERLHALRPGTPHGAARGEARGP